MIENATMEFTNAVSLESSGPLALTLGLMAGFGILIFLCFKYTRRLLRGSIVTGLALGLYKISNWISQQALREGNMDPLKFAGKIGAFIVVSILAGALLGQNKKVKLWEKEIEEAIKYKESK